MKIHFKCQKFNPRVKLYFGKIVETGERCVMEKRFRLKVGETYEFENFPGIILHKKKKDSIRDIKKRINVASYINNQITRNPLVSARECLFHCPEKISTSEFYKMFKEVCSCYPKRIDRIIESHKVKKRGKDSCTSV